MPDPTSDILTGLSQVDILNMQRDTEARYNSLFSPVQSTPFDITQPKVPDFEGGIVKPGQNINQPGYALADFGDFLKTSQSKFPDTFRYQADIRIPQSVTNRYIDENFGYKLERDNEDFYAHQQGAFKEIMKAIFVKLPSYTLTKLGTGVGYLLGLANPANWGENYIEKAGDNAFAKFFSGLEDNLKNKWLTTFRYTVDQNKGFFNRAGTDLSFWTEDLTDGAAFMASAFVPGALVAKLGLGAKIAQGLEMANGLEEASAFTTALAKSAAKYGDRVLTTALNTASESMFEAKGVRDKVYSDLMATGKYSDKEANDIAGQKAKNSFLWNLGLLSFSNTWETNLFYKAMGRGTVGKVEAGLTSLLEDYAAQGQKLSKKLYYGKKALEGLIVEGLYEENIQLAVQRKNEGRNTYDGYFTVLGQLWKQTKDAFEGNDKEAAENIGMGALIGVIAGTGFSAMSREYSKERLQAERLTATLNEAKNNWLKTQDIYSVDGEGKLVEDKGKVAAVLLSQLGITNTLKEGEASNNDILKSLAKKDAFSSFVAAHINQGSFDLLMKQLDQVKSYKSEDLIKLGFDPQIDPTTSVEEFKTYANKLNEIKKSLDNRILGQDAKSLMRRNYLYDVASRQIALEQELGKINIHISSIEGNIGYGSITDGLVNQLNNQRIRIESQKALLEKSSDEDKSKNETKLKKYESALNIVIKNNQEEVDKLKKTSEGFFLYDNNSKNQHPLIADLAKQLVNRAQVENSIDDSLQEFNDVLGSKKEFEQKYEKQVDQVKELIEKTKENIKKEQEKQQEKKKTKEGEPVTEVKQEPIEKKTFTPEQQQAWHDTLVARIPKGNNISLTLLNKISADANKAVESGEITPEQEENIFNILNVKNPVGTLKDTPEDFADQFEEKKKDEEPVQEENGSFNPQTNEVEDVEDLAWSAVAFKSSNKTITQQELEKEGSYLGELDEDPYKVFKQGFLSYLKLSSVALQSYKGKIIKDKLEYPRDKGGKQLTEADMGSVMVITDQKGNVVFFDKDFNPSAVRKEGFQEIIFSINKDAWKELEDLRAFIGQVRTEIPMEKFLEIYQREAEERELARELNNRGIELPVTLNGISNGMIKHGRNSIEAKIVVGDQNYSLYIPTATEKFDIKNPLENKIILNIDGQPLINGAIYIQTQLSEKEPLTYSRIIPNRIGDNPQLFKDLRELLLNKYDDENESDIAKDYLKKILFLGSVARPTVVSTLNAETNKYELALMQDKELMPYDKAVEFINNERLNILSNNVTTNNFDYYSIEDGKLKLDSRNNYKDFVVENSKTRSRSLNTTEGKKLMSINRYAIFQFDDSVENMKSLLAGEDTYPTEDIVDEKTLDLSGLGELVRKANTLKLATQDKVSLEQDPLGFFQYLKEQAIGGNLTTMDKEDQYGKEFMDSLLNFFGISRDNSSLTKEPLQKRERRSTTEEDLNDELKKSESDQDDLLKGLKSAEDNSRAFINSTEAGKVISMFGGDVAVTIHNIYNSEAGAVWNQSGIHLFQNAREGDGYHEAWHNFSQLYLTKRQKTILYNELRNREINFKTRDGRKLNTKNATDLDIEEFMADDFRDYVLSDGKSRIVEAPQRNTIFRKILNFIKSFFFGSVDVKKLYDQLRTGDLNEYTPSINNAFWGKLNSALINDKGEEVFDNRKAAYYRDVVSGIMSKILLEKNTNIESLKSKPALIKIVYDMVYNKILDKIDETPDTTELYDDLYKLTDPDNWNKFMHYHLKYNKLGLFTNPKLEEAINELIKNEENLEDEDYNEADETYDSQEDPDIEDDDPENSANFGSDKSVFDNSGNEVSSLEAATLESRSLVRMLSEASYENGEFMLHTDQNGFEKLCDFSHVWNNLAIVLANKLDYRDMYEALHDRQTQIRIPEINELVKHLPNPDTASSKQELDRIIKFRRDFNRAYVPIFSAKMTETKNFYFLEETKRNSDTIEREWSNNFASIDADSDLVSNGVVGIDEDGRNYINPDTTLTFNLTDEGQRKEFEQLLGFTFSPETFLYPNFRKFYLGFLQSLQTNINARLRTGQKIYNPVWDLKQDLRNDKGEVILKALSGRINAFIEIEAKFSSLNPSMSYLNAEGKMIYGLSLPMFLTKVADLINESKTYQELMARPEAQFLNKENNPYVNFSLILNTIFNPDGSKNKTKSGEDISLQIGNYSGFKISTANGFKASTTTSLHNRDKIIMDLGSLLTSGAIDIMRTETSKTSYFMRLNMYRHGGFLPVPTEQFKSGFRSPMFINYMVGALKDELYRMKNADNIELFKDDEALLKSAKQFNLFRDILTVPAIEGETDQERLKFKIKEDLDNFEIDDIIERHKSLIELAIVDFWNSELESFLDLLNDEGIDRNDFPVNLEEYNYHQLLRSFLANGFTLNNEYTKIFDGDIMYSAHYKDYHKRSKGAISTGIDGTTDDSFVRFMQSNEHNTLAGFLGTAALNDYKTVKSLVIEDDKRDSVYLDKIKENLEKLNVDGVKIDGILKKYTGMTIGDGQGHITLDFYRQFLWSIGNWSDAQEIAYQKELAWFRLNYSNLGEYSEQLRARDERLLEQYQGVQSYFPPIKMQYFGPIVASGTYANVMDKFSVAPLIPSEIQGTPLEAQHLEMIKKGMGYSKFKSGTKKYSAKAHKAYTDAGFDMNLDNYKPPVHYLQFLKEQINTSPTIKEESIFGSQIRKLIMVNLFSNGQARDIDLIRKARYLGILQALRNIEKEKLYNEIGVKEENGVIRVENLERFIRNIQRQADLRELNDNIKNYIQYDKDTNTLRYPLEASLNKKAIQGMLMGIIDNRMRRQKINGDMLIQVSGSGFEANNFKYKNASKEEQEQYGTNGLKFYDLTEDGTQAMQVKVALVGGFEKLLNGVHIDGKPVETRERLNELLRDKDWMKKNKDKVTMIGYRIPTQGINSLEFMEIAEFLPPEAGNIVIPPAEIVAKTGSDFDIDKMSIFRPSFTRLGNLISEESIKELEEELKSLKGSKKIDLLKNKYNITGNLEALSDVLEGEDDVDLDPETKAIKKEIGVLRRAQKQNLSNQIIKLFRDILSDREMYEQLITPNSTDLIKQVSIDVAIAIGKLSKKKSFDKEGNKIAYSGTQILRYKNNLRKFESLTSSKHFLAIAAVNNSFMSILQQNDIGMNLSYSTKSVFRNVRRPVHLLLMDQTERASVMKDGRINISSKFNVHGELKQEYVSQFMNGEVDTPSDDFLGYVNINEENINPIMYWLHQGVPYSRIMWFINQPILLKYYADLKSTNMYKDQLKGKILGDLLGESYFDTLEGEGGIPVVKFNGEKYNKAINTLLNRFDDKKKEGFTEQRLKSNVVRDYNKAVLEDKSYQAAILAYFITAQEQAQLFRNFQSVFSADTRKMQNQVEVFQLLHKVRSREGRSNTIEGNIIDQGLFNEEDIKRISSNSVVSPFIDNRSLIYQIVSKLMPYISNNIFSSKSASFISAKYLTSAKRGKMMNTLENDWLEYIIKSFSRINGLSLSGYSKALLSGKNTLARQLIKMRKLYPELMDQYSIFKKLRQNISTNKLVNKQNIEVQKLFEDNVDDQNRYISEFRQLINFGDSNYNTEQQTQIRNFFRDLAILGFVQSGFNRGPISFQELIPFEETAEMFKDALTIFEKDIAGNGPLMVKFVDEFLSQFKSMNPTLVSKKGRSRQSWRGKDYRLTDALYKLVQIERLKSSLKGRLAEMEKENFSMLHPEIDENGSVLIEKDTMDKISAGKQTFVSLATPLPTSEVKLYDEDNQKALLANLSLFGKYKYNPEENLMYNERTKKSGDPESAALILGYKSFADLGADPNMLAFTAGLQTRNFYKITLLSDKQTEVKENLNDEPVSDMVNDTNPEEDIVDENILKSQEKSVSLSMIEFQEEQSSGYRNRTIKNASADATIAIAVNFNSAGEKLTKNSVLSQKRQYIPIDISDHLLIDPNKVREVVNKLNTLPNEDISINIAGNGIYTMKGKYSQEELDNYVYRLLKSVIDDSTFKKNIILIRTGGQTGLDEAGAKAGVLLGIKTLVLAPKGYTFRNMTGKDISNEKQFKVRFEDIFDAKTKSGTLVSELGITKTEWNNLTKEEQKNIIDCN